LMFRSCLFFPPLCNQTAVRKDHAPARTDSAAMDQRLRLVLVLPTMGSLSRMAVRGVRAGGAALLSPFMRRRPTAMFGLFTRRRICANAGDAGMGWRFAGRETVADRGIHAMFLFQSVLLFGLSRHRFLPGHELRAIPNSAPYLAGRCQSRTRGLCRKAAVSQTTCRRARSNAGDIAKALGHGCIVQQPVGRTTRSTPPVRMLVDRAWQIGLFGNPQHILQRQQTKRRRRLGNEAQG